MIWRNSFAFFCSLRIDRLFFRASDTSSAWCACTWKLISLQQLTDLIMQTVKMKPHTKSQIGCKDNLKMVWSTAGPYSIHKGCTSSYTAIDCTLIFIYLLEIRGRGYYYLTDLHLWYHHQFSVCGLLHKLVALLQLFCWATGNLSYVYWGKSFVSYCSLDFPMGCDPPAIHRDSWAIAKNRNHTRDMAVSLQLSEETGILAMRSFALWAWELCPSRASISPFTTLWRKRDVPSPVSFTIPALAANSRHHILPAQQYLS